MSFVDFTLRGSKNILFIEFYLLFDLYFETFFTFCDDLFHVRDFEILFPWKKIVLWMNIFSPWLWWYSLACRRLERVFYIFSSGLRAVRAGCTGSNIKLGSGLSISRSSKYSYHIRDTAQPPQRGHNGKNQNTKLRTDQRAKLFVLINKYLMIKLRSKSWLQISSHSVCYSLSFSWLNSWDFKFNS